MKLLVKRIMSHFPTKLPVGMTEFHQFADEVIELAGSFADEDSMKWAISSQITHLPHTTASKPKAYFVRCLRKAAANQISAAVFIDIKDRQKQAQQDLQQQAEATAQLLKEKAVADVAKEQES